MLGVGPYVPGVSAAEVKARFGRRDMIRLNWNENLFGPLAGVLEQTAAELHTVWAYPEEAYEEFRQAVARWAGADPGQVIPGHGIQALTLALISAFVEPGDAVVIPRPTYGLYAQACATAGAEVVRVDNAPSLALDLEAVAAAATEHRAKLAWICDPNNPTGLRLSPADWDAFLRRAARRLRGDCRRGLLRLHRPRSADRPAGRHPRRAPGGRPADVLQDLRAGGPAARLPAGA